MSVAAMWFILGIILLAVELVSPVFVLLSLIHILFAELFSSVERLTGPDAAALLQNMAGHYDFHDVRVFTPDGNGRDLEGSVRVEPGEPWFQDVLRGNHDVRFIRNAHGPDNLLFYSPVIRGGEIVGAVAGVYDMAILSRICLLYTSHNPARG